jgi:hypothetical protein
VVDRTCVTGAILYHFHAVLRLSQWSVFLLSLAHHYREIVIFHFCSDQPIPPNLVSTTLAYLFEFRLESNISWIV